MVGFTWSWFVSLVMVRFTWSWFVSLGHGSFQEKFGPMDVLLTSLIFLLKLLRNNGNNYVAPWFRKHFIKISLDKDVKL